MRRTAPAPSRRTVLVAAAIAAALVAGGCRGTAGAPSGEPDRSGTAASPSPAEPGLAAPSLAAPSLAAPSLAAPLPSIVAAGPNAPSGPTEAAVVVRVVDGDTIIVDRGRGDERVRYIGMDTPETVKPNSPVEWMGPEASAANKVLVDGREVVLEKDVSETDRFGRLLRYVWLREPGGTWTMVNLALVERGYANVGTYPPDVKYTDDLLAAERRARAAGVGLWGPAPPS